jgi:transposase-like protein
MRKAIVSAARKGESIRTIARRFNIGLATAHLWIHRAGKRRLNRVDWNNHAPVAHFTCRSSKEIEDLVLTIRRELKESSALGEYGDVAIRRELFERQVEDVPSVRTIARILQRRGVLDGRRRIRRTPPGPGWYLPDVAGGRSELDSFDVVEGLVIEGGIHVEVLNGISIHGGLIGSWVTNGVTARMTVEALMEHWRMFGLPAYAQFDNDTRFQGAHQWKDSIGRVARLCLSLGVTPVFVPPRETGFQAAIESFNGRWQAKVWARFHYDSLATVQAQSARYVAAHRRRCESRIDAAPTRRKFPKSWKLDLQAGPRGRIIFLRRTTEQGEANLLGHMFAVDSNWPHRLVRAEVDLDARFIGFYALRRREPDQQPLLSSSHYKLPTKRFLDV